MPLTDLQKKYIDARNVLALERSKIKAVKKLKESGYAGPLATELIDEIFIDNRSENRKTAIIKLLGSALGLAFFGGIYLFTGRVFFIILPICAFGFIWGIIQFLTASGIEIEVDNSGD